MHTPTLQKNRLYKKYRRLRSLTAHHSMVNQFQPHSLLRLVARNLAATLVINYPPRHNQYTIIQEDCQCRKIKILQDILYRLRGLCRRHETKGNKKPPVQKVQTVAKPHSPSLYGESISALFTTSLGCTTVSATLGVFFPPGRKNNNIIKGGCQCRKIKILRETVRTETLPQSVFGLTTN